MIDLGIAIDFGAWEIPIEYPDDEPAYDEGGNYIPKPKTPDTILGKIQLLKGADLQDMPEGKRSSASMMLGTRSDVPLNAIVTDRNGDKYLVVHKFPSTFGTHCRAAIGRLPNE